MSGLACTRKVTEDEDATELRLGPDFNEAACLSMAEVRLIQQSKIDDDTEAGVDTSTTQTRTFEKTFAYAKRFGGLSNQAVTGQLRELCSARGLMDFETAAVTNLQPQSMDEAKTLVPSLEVESRFTDEQIQTLLDEMDNVRTFE